MKKSTLLKKYDDLTNKVETELRERICKSKLKSISRDTECIKVNIFGFTELVIVDGDLTFLDESGLEYSLYCDCTLLDLIELLD